MYCLPKIVIEPDLAVRDVDGFMTTFERAVLVTLAKQIKARTVLEIGVNEGKTAAVILDRCDSIQHYIGVDVPFYYQPGHAHQKREFTGNPGWFVNDTRFELIIRPRGSLDIRPADIACVPLDMVIIDGDHSDKVVRLDTSLAYTVLQHPGLIVWHDYDPDSPVDVFAYLNELSRSRGLINWVEGTRFALQFVE